MRRTCSCPPVHVVHMLRSYTHSSKCCCCCCRAPAVHMSVRTCNVHSVRSSWAKGASYVVCSRTRHRAKEAFARRRLSVQCPFCPCPAVPTEGTDLFAARCHEAYTHTKAFQQYPRNLQVTFCPVCCCYICLFVAQKRTVLSGRYSVLTFTATRNQ